MLQLTKIKADLWVRKMKKTAIFFVVVMLFLLSGCQKSNKLFDIDNQAKISQNLKLVTEKEEYSETNTVIRYAITNISDFEQCIAGDDNCFSLEKLVDGEWKRVGTKIDHAWNSLGLILPPGKIEAREIKLDDYFYLPLEKGEYRIEVEGIASNTFKIS